MSDAEGNWVVELNPFNGNVSFLFVWQSVQSYLQVRKIATFSSDYGVTEDAKALDYVNNVYYTIVGETDNLLLKVNYKTNTQS
jgi:hypothetical protein